MARHCRFLVCDRVSWIIILLASNLAFSQSVLSRRHKAVSSAEPSGAASSTATTTSAKPVSAAPFVVAPSLPLSGAPSSVAVGDLNGDGKPDLVIANSSANKISVLLGQGNGQFAAPVDYPVGKQPSFVLVADVDGDGKLDVVVANQADGTVSVLSGNGDGTVSKAVNYAAVADPVYLAIGDFNGDGKPDLVVAGHSSDTIALLLNDGNSNFLKPVPYSIGRGSDALAIGDFDGDGHIDIASANADGTVSILLGRGDGSFRAISSMRVDNAALSSIAAGDFNADGKLDLAVTQGTKSLTVLLGKGDGTFSPGSPYVVGNTPAFVIVADVNSDNIPDLITANQSANSFSVLLGNGDGTFKSSLDFVAGNSPRALAAGDFNGDGHVDLAIVNFSDKTVSVPLGNGDGTFNAARAYSVELDRKSVAAGDLDGDGKPDLVVTNFCGTDTSCTSNGTASVLLAVGDGTYRLAGSYSLGAGPLSVALADVNGDKKLDLIVANRGDQSISVLLGNGDGTFQSAVTYPAGNSPRFLATGDFNKDGKIDLAIAGDCGSTTCSEPGSVSVLLGNGDGSFQAAASNAVGYSPSSIAVGDLNGDRNADLVVANACGSDSSCKSNGTASVLVGNGKGGFTPAGEIQLGKGPSSLALGNLNGDDVLDLAVAYRTDNKIGVLIGNGDGTFKPQVTYAVGAAPSALVIADFNGDGKRDIAVANFRDSKVSVLFGNGDGTLQNAVHFAVGVGPESLVAIDSNHSGHADLVTANGNGGLTPQGSDVTVLKNLSINSELLQPVFSGLTSPTILYGTPSVILSGVICVSPSGPCPPMGEQVTITIHGLPPQTATISDNNGDFSATYPTDTIPVGTYSICYNYPGDSNFAPASDCSTALTVNQATPVFTVSSQTVTYGATSVTLSGTICVQPNGPCPPANETVTITVQGLTPQTATITGNNGNFSISYPLGNNPLLAVGTYTVTYSYNGDHNFKSATNNSTALTVNQATPVFTVSSQTVTYGATSVTLSGTICVQPNGPCPPANETVTITVQGLTPQTATITGNNGNFSISYPLGNNPLLKAGTYTITYSYNGDHNFKPATNNSTTLTVNQATPVFTVSSQTVTYGATSVTLSGTICVQPNGPCPPANETVTITVQGLTPQTATITGNNGNFSISYPLGNNPLLKAGTYTITYSYNGDHNFKPATNNSTTLTVNQATPVFTVSSQTVTYGATSVTLSGTICVQPNGPCPPANETVTITVQGLTPQTATITGNNGNFSISYPLGNNPLLKAGTYTITYSYNGDHNFKSATNNSTTLTVNKATPVFTVTSPTPITYGTTSVTLSGVICASGGVCPPMNDQVTITIQGLQPRTAMISDSHGDFSVSYLLPNTVVPGSYTITYNYAGDHNFMPAHNARTSLIVIKATPNATVSSNNNPAVSTQQINLTATVTGPSGALQPTQTVAFMDNGSVILGCASVSLTQGTSNSTATCITNLQSQNQLAPGSHTIVVNYSGDTNYNPVSANLAQTVRDFTLSISALPPVNGGTVVVQSFNNGNQPLVAQTITLTTGDFQSLGFSGNVTLSCVVTPMRKNGPTCTAPGSGAVIAAPNGSTTVTINAPAAAPIRSYTVTLTATDQGLPTLSHQITLPFAVINYSPPGTITPTQAAITSVPFLGPSGSTVTFSCQSLTGLTTTGQQVNATGSQVTQLVTCTTNPQTTTTLNPNSPTSITVSISLPQQTAQLRSSGALAALWLGMPGIVLIGCVRFDKASRKKIFRVLALFLLLLALLQAIGCGGGFDRTQSGNNSLSAGSYQVLVVGTANGTVQTSAVVPFTVIQ